MVVTLECQRMHPVLVAHLYTFEYDCKAKKFSLKEKSHSQALIHVFAMVLFYAARSDTSSSCIYCMLNAKAQ